MHWNLYPFAIFIVAADAFFYIPTIFTAVIPNAFALLEAARHGLFADIFLVIALIAA